MDLTAAPPEVAEPAAEAARAFAARFGRPPRYAAAAPGRVNLIGEHTDYNDGWVLPAAIERRAVVVADRAAGPRSTLWAVDLDETVAADLTAPLAGPRPGFAGYLLGVADGFARAGHGAMNLDVALRSDVPVGAGLASSAAVEVAFALLLRRALGAAIDGLALARLCRRAEHVFAATPCGLMDQYVAVHGRPGAALLLDCRRETARPVPLPRDVTVLVADTGVRHRLADGAYADLRRDCADAAAALGVPALRDATPQAVAEAPLDERRRRCARHVVAENERTLLAAAAMATADLDALGALMYDGHASLRDLLGVSCPELDVLVDAASALGPGRGVIGARMTGGGFGGCAVVLCRAGAAGAVAGGLSRAFTERFGRPPTCFVTPAAGGGAAWDV